MVFLWWIVFIGLQPALNGSFMYRQIGTSARTSVLPYAQVDVRTALHCAMHCIHQSDRCIGFNVHSQGKICQLVNSSANTGAAMLPNEEFDYFEVVGNGYCPCEHDGVCHGRKNDQEKPVCDCPIHARGRYCETRCAVESRPLETSEAGERLVFQAETSSVQSCAQICFWESDCHQVFWDPQTHHCYLTGEPGGREKVNLQPPMVLIALSC